MKQQGSLLNTDHAVPPVHSWGLGLLGPGTGSRPPSSLWPGPWLVLNKCLLRRREGIRNGWAICPMGVGIVEKGDWTRTVTIVPRPIFLSPSAWTAPSSVKSSRKTRNSSRMVVAVMPCLVGDPNPILARPRHYFKPQPQAAASAFLAHLWLQSHCPPPSHFLLPTLGPPRLVPGSVCLGATLLSVGACQLAPMPLSVPSALST